MLICVAICLIKSTLKLFTSVNLESQADATTAQCYVYISA